MSELKKSKGQVFTPDFMAALVVFGVILVIFLNSWNSVISHHTAFETDRIYIEGQQTLTFLVSTPGYPSNWSAGDVQVPGFAERENILDSKKIQEFGDLSYDEKRRLLQAPDFRMEVVSQGEVLYEFGELSDEAEEVMPYRRSVRVNESGNLKDAELIYVVWR